MLKRLCAGTFERFRAAGAETSVRNHVRQAETKHLFAAVAIGYDCNSPLPVRLEEPNLIAERGELRWLHAAVQQFRREVQIEGHTKEFEGNLVRALSQCPERCGT